MTTAVMGPDFFSEKTPIEELVQRTRAAFDDYLGTLISDQQNAFGRHEPRLYLALQGAFGLWIRLRAEDRVRSFFDEYNIVPARNAASDHQPFIKSFVNRDARDVVSPSQITNYAAALQLGEAAYEAGALQPQNFARWVEDQGGIRDLYKATKVSRPRSAPAGDDLAAPVERHALGPSISAVARVRIEPSVLTGSLPDGEYSAKVRIEGGQAWLYAVEAARPMLAKTATSC